MAIVSETPDFWGSKMRTPLRCSRRSLKDCVLLLPIVLIGSTFLVFGGHTAAQDAPSSERSSSLRTEDRSRMGYRFDEKQGDTVIYVRLDFFTSPAFTYKQPITYKLMGIWRYVFGKEKWHKFSFDGSTKTVAFNSSDRAYPMATVLGGKILPVGLYYAIADVNGVPERSLVFHGPVLCDDIDIGPVPEGMIATCVPFEDSATSTLVPDPDQLSLEQ